MSTTPIIGVMPTAEQAQARLAGIPGLELSTHTPLSQYTRFGLGGDADLYAETGSEDAFVAALAAARAGAIDVVVIGEGTNLIVSDDGFRGLVLRFRADGIRSEGNRVSVDAGASLGALVDFTVERGLQGLETLAGIPGSVGAAVYGNAGAYGPCDLRAHRERPLLRRLPGSHPRTTGSAGFNTARAFSRATKSGRSSPPNCGWTRPIAPRFAEPPPRSSRPATASSHPR